MPLLTFLGKLLAAAPHVAGRRAKRLALAGTLVVGAIVFAPAGGATADPVSDTQGQIVALQRQIDAGAVQLHQLTAAFQQANLQAATLAQQVATDDATLASMQHRLGASQNALTSAALHQYTGQPQAPAAYALGADPAVKAEYLALATGNVADSVDQLKVAEDQVTEQRQVVATEQAQAQVALRSASTARSQALALATTEQSRLTSLGQQLAQQVAAQRAADAAAAQAAAAQAAQAAAARAASSATRSAAPTQGGPVNGGLVATVQAAVAPTPPPAASSSGASSSGGGAGGVWLQLRECESGDDYQANTGNGFYGAYQFTASTWSGLGLPGRPDQEPPAMQDQAAQELQARSGWGQWPACSAALGLT